MIVAGQLIGYLLRRSADVLNLGGADRIAGGAFGLLQGLLLCQVLLVALVIFPQPDIRTHIEDSPLATRLLDGAPLALSILPTTSATPSICSWKASTSSRGSTSTSSIHSP